MDGFRRLIVEIHHRSLWQVLAIYLAGSWVALQVVDTLDQTLSLPEWAPGLAFVLLVIGLPFVLATAFVHEGSAEARPAEAARADPSADPTDSAAPPAQVPRAKHPVFRRRNVVIGAVAGIALWGILSAGWIFFGPDSGGTGDAGTDVALAGAPNTIAVLPFANISGAEDAEPFTVGIHDDILTQLSKIRALQVTSRTSVLDYRDSTRPISEIADELGVTAVLEGGVQRAGGRVRINVQLIDSETDRHLWAETYDREFTAENVFDIQAEIALSVAQALRAELAPDEQAAVAEVPTRDLEALALYHRGRELFFDRLNPDSALAATTVLEAAVERDPGFAAAWAELAKARSWLTGGWGSDTREVEAALARVTELSPGSFEAEMAGGYFDYYGRHDYPAALDHFEAATRLRPTDVDATLARALIYRRLDRWDEAVDLFEQAAAIDPRNTRPLELLAITLSMLRRFDAALDRFARAAAIAPGDVLLLDEYVQSAVAADDTALAAKLVTDHRLDGRPEAVISTTALAQARRDYESGLRLAEMMPVSPMPMYRAMRLATVGYAHELAGNTETALAYADSLESAVGALPELQLAGLREFFLGLALVGQGRNDEARPVLRSCLEKADPGVNPVELIRIATLCYGLLAAAGAEDEAIDGLIGLAHRPNRDLSVGWLRHDPGYRDGLSGNPRFPELVRTMEQIERAAAAAQ